MTTLSEIVEPFYQQSVSTLGRSHILLDIDIPDPYLKVNNATVIKKWLQTYFKEAESRMKRTKISLAVKNDELIIKDEGLLLNRAHCQELSSDIVKVSSRVGFGTTTRIKI